MGGVPRGRTMCVGYVTIASELILLGLLIGGGVLIAAWIVGRPRDASEAPRDLQNGVLTSCHRCQHLNPTHARYCARCGCSLE